MIKFHSPTPNRCKCKSKRLEELHENWFCSSFPQRKKIVCGLRQKHGKFQPSWTTEKERQKPKLNFTFRVHNLYSLQRSILQAFLELHVKWKSFPWAHHTSREKCQIASCWSLLACPGEITDHREGSLVDFRFWEARKGWTQHSWGCRSQNWGESYLIGICQVLQHKNLRKKNLEHLQLKIYAKPSHVACVLGRE